eukprot:4391555-Karenia_brevis.AAC.1
MRKTLKSLGRRGSKEEQRALKTVAKGGLWLRSRLHDQGYNTLSTCVLCGGGPETEAHIFWECPECNKLNAPEVQETNWMRSLATQPHGQNSKWLRGITPASETINLTKQYEVDCATVRLSPKFQEGEVEDHQEMYAGTDASGGEHTADPRLRKVGWAFVIFDTNMVYKGAARGDLEGRQT